MEKSGAVVLLHRGGEVGCTLGLDSTAASCGSGGKSTE
jgi:hypothetical protein